MRPVPGGHQGRGESLEQLPELRRGALQPSGLARVLLLPERAVQRGALGQLPRLRPRHLLLLQQDRDLRVFPLLGGQDFLDDGGERVLRLRRRQLCFRGRIGRMRRVPRGPLPGHQGLLPVRGLRGRTGLGVRGCDQVPRVPRRPVHGRRRANRVHRVRGGEGTAEPRVSFLRHVHRREVRRRGGLGLQHLRQGLLVSVVLQGGGGGRGGRGHDRPRARVRAVPEGGEVRRGIVPPDPARPLLERPRVHRQRRRPHVLVPHRKLPFARRGEHPAAARRAVPRGLPHHQLCARRGRPHQGPHGEPHRHHGPHRRGGEEAGGGGAPPPPRGQVVSGDLRAVGGGLVPLARPRAHLQEAPPCHPRGPQPPLRAAGFRRRRRRQHRARPKGPLFWRKRPAPERPRRPRRPPLLEAGVGAALARGQLKRLDRRRGLRRRGGGGALERLGRGGPGPGVRCRVRRSHVRSLPRRMVHLPGDSSVRAVRRDWHARVAREHDVDRHLWRRLLHPRQDRRAPHPKALPRGALPLAPQDPVSARLGAPESGLRGHKGHLGHHPDRRLRLGEPRYGLPGALRELQRQPERRELRLPERGLRRGGHLPQ
mmetsp:Transcript_70913/g.160466  ORF Transcript_70913/g.160466 Transcript_70913/m.160466 type:complete len:596 (-) Transcript_70913:4170-5957(-)